MKSCFNIFRGFIAAILFLVYFVILLVSFIVLPFTSILKDAKSLNKAIDNARVEARIAELLTTSAVSLPGTEGTTEEIPEIDFAEVLDADMVSQIVTLRREVITVVYTALENNQALTYEVDIQFLNDLYFEVMGQMMAEQMSGFGVCEYWMDPTQPLDMENTCLPPHIAIANGIEVPDSVVVPEGFEPTDEMKFSSIIQTTEDFEIEKIENPVIEIDQETATGFYGLLIIFRIYPFVFIGLLLILFLIYLLISPARKAAIIAIGILHIITSIIAVILWNAPQLLIKLSQLGSMIPQEQMAIQKGATDIAVALINEIARKGLIMALCIGIIGVLIIVLAIFLPKKKKNEEQEKPKEESKQQPAGKDNSSK